MRQMITAVDRLYFYFVDTFFAVKQNADRLPVAFLRFENHLAAGTAGRNRIINKVFLRSGGDSKCDDGLVGVPGVGIE